jgi:hypothetical protein
MLSELRVRLSALCNVALVFAHWCGQIAAIDGGEREGREPLAGVLVRREALSIRVEVGNLRR